MAYDNHELDLQARIQIRLHGVVPPQGTAAARGLDRGRPRSGCPPRSAAASSTRRCPRDFPFVNFEVGQGRQLTVIVNSLAETYPKVEVAAALDALKDAVAFHWATRAGVYDRRSRMSSRRRTRRPSWQN